jgi:hypothetical protein
MCFESQAVVVFERVGPADSGTLYRWRRTLNESVSWLSAVESFWSEGTPFIFRESAFSKGTPFLFRGIPFRLQNETGFQIRERDPNWEELIRGSVFHLCPRGNGPTSYRLFESLQAGTIPIYIWEEVRLLPFYATHFTFLFFTLSSSPSSSFSPLSSLFLLRFVYFPSPTLLSFSSFFLLVFSLSSTFYGSFFAHIFLLIFLLFPHCFLPFVSFSSPSLLLSSCYLDLLYRNIIKFLLLAALEACPALLLLDWVKRPGCRQQTSVLKLFLETVCTSSV